MLSDSNAQKYFNTHAHTNRVLGNAYKCSHTHTYRLLGDSNGM